ncbi:MAG: helix-turn-helix transcriptional regulator [Pseudomonadota bacterium]
MGTLKKQFGKRMKTLRTSAKMTQEQLANDVGVTIESISNIERGIHGPSFDTLEKIAEVLKIPVQDLFVFE